jgi:FxLD family lantipeptide
VINVSPVAYDCVLGAPDTADELAEFELDVEVTIDVAAGHAGRACDSSDGCGSTCGSACVSS